MVKIKEIKLYDLSGNFLGLAKNVIITEQTTSPLVYIQGNKFEKETNLKLKAVVENLAVKEEIGNGEEF